MFERTEDVDERSWCVLDAGFVAQGVRLGHHGKNG